MPEMTLTQTRIQSGVWSGVLTADRPGAPPEVEARHLDTPLPGVRVTELPQDGNAWEVTIPIPSTALNEGVQTILISDRQSGAKLGSFSIVTGAPVEDDIRAEVELLRAELDLLKRAFRRHCVETAG